LSTEPSTGSASRCRSGPTTWRSERRRSLVPISLPSPAPLRLLPSSILHAFLPHPQNSFSSLRFHHWMIASGDVCNGSFLFPFLSCCEKPVILNIFTIFYGPSENCKALCQWLILYICFAQCIELGKNLFFYTVPGSRLRARTCFKSGVGPL
jgi:hypothetical protein